MTKQEAYAELRRMIDDATAALDKARGFANMHDLVMSHKDPVRREYYGGDLDDLLTVKTLEDKDVKDWNNSGDVEEEERSFEYFWVPSSLRC